MVTTTDCTSGCFSRRACTTSTPEPSGRPRSTMATSKRTALTSSSASWMRALSLIWAPGNTCSASVFSQARISGRSSRRRICFMVSGASLRFGKRYCRSLSTRTGRRATTGPSQGPSGRQDLLHCGDFQRQGQADDGAEPRPGLDQALPVELFGAVLHAGHAVATVQAAVELHRDAFAIVLDHQREDVVFEVDICRNDHV